MKKAVILTIIMIFTLSVGYGQNHKKLYRVKENKYKRYGWSLKHMPGVSGFELNTGITGVGIYGALYYSLFMSPKFHFKAGGGYEYGLFLERNKYSSFFVDGLVGYSFFNIKKILYLNGLVGVTGSMDQTSGSMLELTRTYRYGAVVGGELEVYASDKLAILLSGNQRFLLDNKDPASRFMIGLGAKYCFN